MKKLLSILSLFAAVVSASASNANPKPPQMVFTHEEYDNFETALPHALTEVKDGESLWVYAKFAKPIGTYVNVSKFTDKDGNVVENISFMMHFVSNKGIYGEQPVFVKGGEKSPNGMVFNKGYVAYLDNIDLEKTMEVKLCLSQYIRHKSSFVFLKMIGKSEAARLDTELTLVGKNDVVFSRGTLTCSLESGFPAYKKAWNAYEEITQKGDVADNVLPPTGKFNDDNVKAAIIKEAKTIGITAEKVVFTKDAWSERITQEVPEKRERIVYSYIRYKKGSRCLYAMAEVVQKLVLGNWGPSLVRLYNTDSPIDCGK